MMSQLSSIDSDRTVLNAFQFFFLLIHIFIRFSVGLQRARSEGGLPSPPLLALVYITRFSLISNRFVTTPKLICRLWFDKWDPIRSQLLSHYTYHFQDIQIFICISSMPEPVIKLRARIKRQQHQRDCLISFLVFSFYTHCVNLQDKFCNIWNETRRGGKWNLRRNFRVLIFMWILFWCV